MRQLTIKFERQELPAPNAKFSEFAEKLIKEQSADADLAIERYMYKGNF